MLLNGNHFHPFAWGQIQFDESDKKRTSVVAVTLTFIGY